MNLLRRRVEMPEIVWKDRHLTCDEKALIAMVYSLGHPEGIVVPWKDIADTLQLSMSAADNLVGRLSGRGYLSIVKEAGQRCRLQIGCRFSDAIDRERIARKADLRMCFIQCLCGVDLRMDYVHQIRVCPECRRAVFYTEAAKKYMLRRRIGRRLINNR